MKDKIIQLIISHGQGLTELVFDFEIDEVIFNSIEWLPEDDSVILHIFEYEDSDVYCDLENMDIDKQIKVYKILNAI